jgi:hypothetical protein
MRINIARHRQLPERLAQRIALRRQRRVVEVKICAISLTPGGSPSGTLSPAI